MRSIYKITIAGIAVAAGLSFAAAKIFADNTTIVSETETKTTNGVSLRMIRDAAITDKSIGES